MRSYGQDLINYDKSITIGQVVEDSKPDNLLGLGSNTFGIFSVFQAVLVVM